MNSTTTSDKILIIRNLNLSFRLRHYQPRSLRELFVSKIHSANHNTLPSREILPVLRNINLTLRRGDRLAILGVNGGGKTTLCRCIADILHPASGTITIRGKCRAVFNTQVGLIPELTGRENARLLMRLMFQQESIRSIERMTQEACEFSGLNSFLDTPFETYSQGMKARLCLSVITAKSSDLLILDEVYDNTDCFFQEKMSARLKKFIANSQSVIFVSHSPDYIRRVCNRAIVLHQGKIVFNGDVESALAAYQKTNANPPP